jgi:PBP superfamily domain
MRRAERSSSRTITCPDCGLVLRIVDDAPGREFIYDMRAWRLVCRRVHLGDPAWCLVQRDGTHPLLPAMDRDKRGRNIADLVIIGSHCVGLERIIERLEEEGLAVKAMSVGSAGGLAAVKRGECDVAPVHLMDSGTGEYNKPFLSPGMELVRDYRRLQGNVFRRGDPRGLRGSRQRPP